MYSLLLKARFFFIISCFTGFFFQIPGRVGGGGGGGL